MEQVDILGTWNIKRCFKKQTTVITPRCQATSPARQYDV